MTPSACSAYSYNVIIIVVDFGAPRPAAATDSSYIHSLHIAGKPYILAAGQLQEIPRGQLDCMGIGFTFGCGKLCRKVQEIRIPADGECGRALCHISGNLAAGVGRHGLAVRIKHPVDIYPRKRRPVGIRHRQRHIGHILHNQLDLGQQAHKRLVNRPVLRVPEQLRLRRVAQQRLLVQRRPQLIPPVLVDSVQVDGQRPGDQARQELFQGGAAADPALEVPAVALSLNDPVLHSYTSPQ